MLSGRVFNERKQLHAVAIGDLVLPVVFSPVSQSHWAVLDEPLGDSVHLGLRAQTALSDHSRSLALNQTEDDLATTTHDRVRSSHAIRSNLVAFATRKPLPCLNDHCLNQGGAPSIRVLRNTT
jgi:hypothetical protein